MDGETTELKNNENFLNKMIILVYWINYSLCSRKWARPGRSLGSLKLPTPTHNAAADWNTGYRGISESGIALQGKLEWYSVYLAAKKAIKTETNVIKYWDADHKIVEFDSFMALADNIEN